MKKKKTFKIVLLIYTMVWVFAIVGICMKLWSAFDQYQMNYVQASENANPDLVMEEVLADYQEESIMHIAESFLPAVNEYENMDEIEKRIKGLVSGKELSFRREERFTDKKPVYEVLADHKIIGLVSLKQGTQSDMYGFRACEVDEETLNLDFFEMQEYQILVPQEYDVFVNGNKVDKKYQVVEMKLDSAMAGRAAELTDNDKAIGMYQLKDFLLQPEVKVTDAQQSQELLPDENNVFECSFFTDEDFLKQVEEYVLEAGKSYVLNANQMESFEAVAKYLKKDSNAYANVKSVQSGLTWAGKPDKLDIVESRIADMIIYSDDVFTVKTYYRINRLYRDVTYDEIMSHEWLFIRNQNKWLIEDFAIVKE